MGISRKMSDFNLYVNRLSDNKIKLGFTCDGEKSPWPVLPVEGDVLLVDTMRVEVITRTLYMDGDVELLTRIIE